MKGKIILSLILAFILTILIYRYVDFATKPVLNQEKISEDLQGIHTIALDQIGKITAKTSSIFISLLRPIAQNNSSTETPAQQLTDTPGGMIFKPGANKTTLPPTQVVKTGLATPTLMLKITQPLPTNIPTSKTNPKSSVTPKTTGFIILITPTSSPNKTPIILPTYALPTSGGQNPNNTPKPTKKPKATPTPKLIVNAVRPGNNKEEVMEIVSKLMCVPVPMLKAVYLHETGWSPTLVSKYTEPWSEKNTYQGYDSAGSAPATSIIGPMQMMADTWRRIKPYVSDKLGGVEISMDVFFDAVAGAGFHLRNVSLAGREHAACDDWGLRYIAKGACKYGASCGGSANYCVKIYESYNSYAKGPKKNCSQIPNVISMDGMCELK